MRVKGGNTQKVMPEMKLKTENKSQRQKKKVKKEKKNPNKCRQSRYQSEVNNSK